MRKLTLHKPALDDYVDVEKDLNENYRKIEEWANSSGTELDNKFDDGGVSTDYDTAKKMEDKIKFLATQIEKTPIGTILPFAGGTIPKDYLLCDGREITKNDYSELYDILPFGGYIDEKVFRGLAKNEVPNMTGPTLNGYTITESSVFSATFPGWKAFDSVISGDNGGWASLTGQKEGWVQIQYPNKRALSSFTIKTRTYDPGSKLEKISVYGVTTTSEEELFTENLSRAFTTNEKREFKVNFNKKTYDKFKIKVSAPNDQYCAIDEIELFTVDITQFPNHKQETTKKYLPDLRGQFLRGIKDRRKLLDWENEDIKKHNHKVPLAYPPESSVTNTLKEYTEVREKKTIFQTLMLDDNVNDNVYGRPIAKETYEGNETRPSNIGVNYIIKAKNGINDNSIPAYIESLLNDLNNLKNNLGQHIKDNSISSSKLKTDSDADKIKLANLAEEVVKKLGDAVSVGGKTRVEFEQDVESAKKELEVLTNTGIKKINQNVVWKIGGLNRDGSINNNKKNRAYTDLILHLHKSQTITAPEGFLISIVFYNELGNVTEAFNPAPTQQIAENSRFKIGIIRKSEISTENWDTNSLPFPKDFLNEYVNYSLKTQVLEKIENNINAIKELNNNPAINIPYEYYGKTNIGFNYDTIESVKFVSDIESTVNISSATIADIDNISDVKYSNIDVLKQIDGSYKFTLNNPSTNVYQNRISGKLNNLVIGAKYKIVLKLKSTLEKNRFVQIQIGNKNYKTLSGYNEKENAYIFDYESILNTSEIAIYPFLSNDIYTPTTGEKIEIYDFYITRVFDGIDEFKHFNVYKNLVSITVNKETIVDGFGGMICESTNNIDVYSKIKRSKIIMINNEFPNKNGNINIKKSHLDGKVCVCIGDSITHKGHSSGCDYVSKLEKNTGIDCHNFGFGGCQMHVRGNANWDAFSMIGLADAITSGDWSAQEQASSDNKFEIYDYAATKTAWAKSFDWSKVNYITVAFGANDISTDPNASIIDNPENPYDKSTYLGSFRYSYEKIMSVYPNIRFLILTPIFRWWIITGEYINSDNRIFANGHHYRDWGDALIEECKKYHIPYLNMYDDAGINDHNRLYYFDETDGTHPNEKGLELMGDVLTGSILSRY